MTDQLVGTCDNSAEQIQILQTTLNNIGAYVYSKDTKGRYTYANQKVCDLFGVSLEEIIGYDDSHFFSLEHSDDLKENDSRVLQYGETVQKEERNIISSTGETRYYLSVKKPLFNSDNDIIGLSGVSTDITHLKQSELQHIVHNEVMSLIVDKAPLKTILTSLSEGIERLSPSAMSSILLIDDSGKHLLFGAAPSLPEFYNNAIDGIEIGDAVGSCGTAAFNKKRVIVENISTHPYWAPYVDLAKQAGVDSCWSEPILSTEGKILGTFAIYHQCTSSPTEYDFKVIEFAAQLATVAIEQHRSLKQQQLFQQIYDDSHEGIMILDPEGHIINANAAFSDITGYSLDQIEGQTLESFGSNEQGSHFYEQLSLDLKKNTSWQNEIWCNHKEGKPCLLLLNISTLFDQQGQLLNYVGIFSDITESKRQQEALELMAHYDVLTKLPNRVLFEDRFNQAVAHSKRSKSQLAVCFIDLDNFKPVNDTFGHKTGDALLIEIAQRLNDVIREQDTVSRQGGDEFALLLGDIGPDEHYENIIERIHRSLAKSFIINDQTHKVTASIGVALYPLDGENIDVLLRHADQAMYQAKLLGKHRFEFFNLNQHQK